MRQNNMTNIDSIDLPKHIGGTMDLNYENNLIISSMKKFPDYIGWDLKLLMKMN